MFLARCLWCRKLLTRKKQKYCNKWCKSKNLIYNNRSNNDSQGKNKKRYIKSIRTYYWSKTEGKTVHFRSLFERSYAQWLDKNKIRWRFEPKLFQLSQSKYLPDFYLVDSNEWIEVKGRWRVKSKQKYEEFQKLYPNEKISVVGPEEIKEIRKQLL